MNGQNLYECSLWNMNGYGMEWMSNIGKAWIIWKKQCIQNVRKLNDGSLDNKIAPLGFDHLNLSSNVARSLKYIKITCDLECTQYKL